MTYNKSGNKDIQKCIRMTKDTYDFIMTFDGEGFNQKFDTACKLLYQRRQAIELQIESAEKERQRIMKEIYDLSRLSSNISDITRYMDYVQTIIQRDLPKFDLDNK